MRLIDADKSIEYMKEQQLEAIKRKHYVSAANYQTIIDVIREQPTVKIRFGSRSYFNGKCPYTDKECESWACLDCEVEQAEREYMESEV